MVSIFEGAIYVAALGLSVLSGAATLLAFGHVPMLADALGDLARSTWWLCAAAIGGVALIGLVLYRWPYTERTITFRQLKGPEPEDFFWGSIRAIMAAGPLELHSKWIKQYGSTFRYRILGGGWRFFTADPVALSYVLQHADTFPKPDLTRQQMETFLGNGVLIAEGADHRRQRKILNPSFSPAAVRGMVPIFLDKAYDLRDKLQGMISDPTIEASPTPASEVDTVPGTRKIDVMRYLAQATLNVIGLAGFNYDFRSLSTSEGENELAEAYRNMFQATQTIDKMAILQAFVKPLRSIPTERTKRIIESRLVTERIGRRLIEEKKYAIQSSHANGLEKGEDIGKDLLSILIRANMATDLRPDQKLSDDEVLAQITTFMLAGNETSSTALTWTLYALAKHPESQDKLREELMAVNDERPSMEDLAALPYLDAVIREVLRLWSPAPNTIRVAKEKVVIPLGTPIEGRDGQLIESVTLNRGTQLFIPILAVNQSPLIWGADAEDYNPERYFTESATKEGNPNQVPGIWGNLLTFLGGQRNCIGYRFALAEIRAILFVLIRSFQFEELPSKPEIEKKANVVMRPRVKSEQEAGLQMPLLVRPLSG